jgi:FG-GAP repeat protein
VRTAIALFASSAALAAGCDKILGVNDVTLADGGNMGAGAPRLIAPGSMSIVTQAQPSLHWVLDGDGTPEVDLCRDRACTSPLAVTTQLAGDRLSAAPAAPLPHGWVYWRVRITSGTQELTSATWQFWVGATSTATVDASNGAMLDINGDGFPDLLIGAFGAGSGAGTVHVYLGSASASAADWNATSSGHRIDLTSPDGNGASFGFAVASAGDVNGDGFADFVVGAYGVNHNAGTIHVYLGSANPSAADWNGANAANRIDIASPDIAGAVFGGAVAAAGDVNRDGYADFVVGASKAGLAHLFLGSAAPTAADWAKGQSTNRIDLVDPGTTASAFGNAVAAAGDVNGDGFADFLIGADGASTAAGAVHVYLGSAMPTARTWNTMTSSARIDLADPDGATASFGSAVTCAGDVNGDGFADFLVAARTAGGDAGAAHLYLGASTLNAVDWNTGTRRVDLVDPDGDSAVFGSAIASAGDVNGDGFADFVIGADGVDLRAGAAHVYLGAAALNAARWNGAAATAADRIDLANPAGKGAGFGAAAASAGDVNGDGFLDFVVGADEADSLGGASQLYLGSATPSTAGWNGAARIDLTNPAGASARFGVSVASAACRCDLAHPAQASARIDASVAGASCRRRGGAS